MARNEAAGMLSDRIFQTGVHSSVSSYVLHRNDMLGVSGFLKRWPVVSEMSESLTGFGLIVSWL